MTIDRTIAPDVEAYRLMRAGRFVDALPHAQRAVAGQRVCLPGHGLLATILLHLGRASEAELVVAEALQCAQGSADAYDGLAYVSMQLGRHERANQLYRRATQLAPQSPRFWYNLASSERSFGRLAEAEAACDRVIALDSTQYPSYLLRSELRIQTEQSNHVAQLLRLLTRHQLEDRASVLLGYALGKELDDLHQFDEAFRWFSTAAAIRRGHLAYDVGIDERKLQRIAAAFPQDSAQPAPGAGDSSRFIFIFGLPRSGTTLLERILTGLDGVRSNGETDNFTRALLEASPPEEGQDVFERAAAANPGQVAANYRRFAGSEASSGEIVEKLPMNYLYLGAIRRALPESRLILVTRSPLDSCFAMYRTLFSQAYPFTYDFEDLARYYAAYDRLMHHWRATLHGQLHEVVYEDLVRDPSRIGREVAEYCGLAWTSQAIEVQKNASVSLTASASQVRRPIYGSSSGRWRHYRQHLRPLIAALRRCRVPLPEDA
jgi:tetratricopeptide (TPR) repeat protein